MRTIYYQDRPIFISSNPDLWRFSSDGMFIEYDSATLKESIHVIGRGDAKALFVHTPDENETLTGLKNILYVIHAAGGVVYNDAGEVLIIRRNNKWDLPKGKLEKGEEVAEGAAREIEEECAVQVKIKKPLINTYHIYDEKGKQILKETHWFIAEVKGTPDLKPQTEEGITEVKWFRKDELQIVFDDTYANIIEVLKAYLNCSSES